MNSIALLKSAAILTCLTQAVAFADNFTLTFADQTALDASFPTQLTNNGSTISTVDSDLRLHANSSAYSGSAIATAYSAASFSDDLDFISRSVSVSFQGVTALTVGSGLNYSGILGISNNNTSDDYLSRTSTVVPGYAVYFEVSRIDTSLKLIYKFDDSITVLSSWSLSGNFAATGNISLTLTDSSWATDGSYGTKSITSSGTFASALTSEAWGSDFYLVGQSSQYGSGSSRELIFDVNQINITSSSIPEPSTAAIFAGLSAIALGACARRRQ